MRMMQMRPFVNQVDRQHQVAVGQDLQRCAGTGKAMVFAEHETTV
jgi:hypothetical protein